MNRQTQKARILAALKARRSLTPLDGLAVAGTLKLATRISELKDDGYPIIGRWETKRGKRYMRYSMGRMTI